MPNPLIENTQYVHGGEIQSCGHCQPDKDFDLPEKYGAKCECKCHNSDPLIEEYFETIYSLKNNKMKKEEEKHLLRLLEQYHHYLFMSSGFFGIFKGWQMGMNLGGFMQWLKSRQD